jgi:peptidoglycan hydrolase CwlO-like protein
MTPELILVLRLDPLAVRQFDGSEGSRIHEAMTAKEDIALVAGQLANLTRTVQQMQQQLTEVRERADNQQERTDVQQERIELAARELNDVSERLQAAANALRESI